jgi:hypothetical protein
MSLMCPGSDAKMIEAPQPSLNAPRDRTERRFFPRNVLYGHWTPLDSPARLPGTWVRPPFRWPQAKYGATWGRRVTSSGGTKMQQSQCRDHLNVVAGGPQL